MDKLKFVEEPVRTSATTTTTRETTTGARSSRLTNNRSFASCAAPIRLHVQSKPVAGSTSTSAPDVEMTCIANA